MEERSCSQLLQRNERVKALSMLGMNLGTGLLAAGSARWFFERLDEHVMLWLLAAIALIWVGVYALIMLEAES